jgi:hypothetical protein
VTQAALKRLPNGAEPEPPAARIEPLELTILMPCLNEAETIEVCVRKALSFMTRSGVSGEVLVADNGSTDGSQMLATRAGARVVLAMQKGYGAALSAGIAEARGRFVVMGDADDSYDFERLDAMLAALRSGAELVMGNRFKGGIAQGAMPFLHRYLGNPVLSALGRLFFATPVGDFHCGLRGFSRTAVADLRLQSLGMEFASEMVVKATLGGLRIVEVPTTLSPDGRSRPPHLKTWRDGWRHLRFLLLHSPRWLFIYPGCALAGLGLFGQVMLARGPAQVTPGVQLDVHTLVAACFAVLVGTQLVLFGALARRYAMVEGVLPASGRKERFLLGMTLETVLRTALGVLLLGLGGAVWASARWAVDGLGPIHDHNTLRLLLLSLTAVSAAVQVGAGGFFGSILSVRKPG